MVPLSDKEDVALLWTGGWDSTFQLLQLLLVQRRRVTPFYLMHPKRLSTDKEIRTMKRIQDHILKEYPHTFELLHPTQYFSATDIPPDPEISETYQSLRKENYMGRQYDWLSRFCKANGIADIQLCIHRHDKAHFFVEQIVSEGIDGLQTVFRVDPKFKNRKEYVLFRYFSFPIFELSKVEMAAVADKRGWKEIMNMTWFCHTPTKNETPCGKCNPCLYTIEEGLGWRIPLKGRIVSVLYRGLVRPLRSLAKLMLGQLGLLEYIHKGA